MAVFQLVEDLAGKSLLNGTYFCIVCMVCLSNGIALSQLSMRSLRFRIFIGQETSARKALQALQPMHGSFRPVSDNGLA